MTLKRRDLEFLFDFVCSDFKKKYLGSLLGVGWAFVFPVVTIFILIVVFQLGFKISTVSILSKASGAGAAVSVSVPYSLWLISGLVPWFFFSDAIVSATASLYEYGFVIKKVPFPVHLLPMVKIFSAAIIHLGTLAFAIVFVLLMKIPLSLLALLQLFYYFIAGTLLLIGLSLILSSLAVLAKDMIYLVAVLVQFLFWATPIFWNIEQIPVKYQAIFQANPLYYVIEGYRDTFLRGVFFWEQPLAALYFWTICGTLLLFGWWWFKKLRPQFADLL